MIDREIMQQALDALEYHTMQTRPIYQTGVVIELLEAELAKPEQEPVTNSVLYSTAGRLALELECLLLDTKDISIVSKWWDSAHEALDQWHKLHLRACAALDKKAENARELGLDYEPRQQESKHD